MNNFGIRVAVEKAYTTIHYGWIISAKTEAYQSGLIVPQHIPIATQLIKVLTTQRIIAIESFPGEGIKEDISISRNRTDTRRTFRGSCVSNEKLLSTDMIMLKTLFYARNHTS